MKSKYFTWINALKFFSEPRKTIIFQVFYFFGKMIRFENKCGACRNIFLSIPDNETKTTNVKDGAANNIYSKTKISYYDQD